MIDEFLEKLLVLLSDDNEIRKKLIIKTKEEKTLLFFFPLSASPFIHEQFWLKHDNEGDSYGRNLSIRIKRDIESRDILDEKISPPFGNFVNWAKEILENEGYCTLGSSYYKEDGNIETNRIYVWKPAILPPHIKENPKPKPATVKKHTQDSMDYWCK